MKGQIGGRFQAPPGGRGRMSGPKAGGPSGFCVCPKCGYSIAHDIAMPCYQVKCARCGTTMVRE